MHACLYSDRFSPLSLNLESPTQEMVSPTKGGSSYLRVIKITPDRHSHRATSSGQSFTEILLPK